MLQSLQYLIPKLIGFALVGVVGYFVDTGTLYAFIPLFGEYGARIVSFLVAVTFTYSMNRLFVFSDEAKESGWMKGWAKFFSANLTGGFANLFVYTLLMKFQPLITWEPYMAVACGVLVGLAFNFTLTTLFVFKRRELADPDEM